MHANLSSEGPPAATALHLPDKAEVLGSLQVSWLGDKTADQEQNEHSLHISHLYALWPALFSMCITEATSNASHSFAAQQHASRIALC